MKMKTNKLEKDWWKKAVVYQIYPRSFQDSNDDGIGDIQGIISRLPYIKQLGADVIWLCPVYASPNDDNGYDISDYCDIMKEFGTMQDMEELLDKANAMDIKIIMDLVVNHTSDEHAWFKEAKKSKDNPYHDYYIWVDGEEGVLPNDLKSDFGGSAWEYVPACGQYYLHFFSKKQPDLNWENSKMRKDIYAMMNYWIDKGISGFRMDMIELIGKEPMQMIRENGPKLHNYIKEMNAATFGKANLLTVGEAWRADIEKAQQYSNPDGSELSMVFQFEHMKLDKQPKTPKWDVTGLRFQELKEVLSKWQYGLEGTGWNSLFWNNHDLPRIVSRWGNDGKYRVESAKMLAMVLHGMKGTPYIYQGEEIGMTNIALSDIKDYRDIETLNMYKERLEEGYTEEEIMHAIHLMGRDNARTPMQWNAQENAGFSKHEPWLCVNPNYREINVEQALKDQHSIFYTYQKLIQMRKEMEILSRGDYHLLDTSDQIFAYERNWNDQKLVVIANFFEKPCAFPDMDIERMQVLLHNYEAMDNKQLRAYEAMILFKE